MLNRWLLALLILPLITGNIIFTGCGNPSSTPQPLPAGTGNLQINVKDAENQPLQGAKVVSSVQPDGQLLVSGITDADGTVVFIAIKAGPYQFTISRADFKQEQINFNVVAGQTTIVTVNIIGVSPPPFSPSPSST